MQVGFKNFISFENLPNFCEHILFLLVIPDEIRVSERLVNDFHSGKTLLVLPPQLDIFKRMHNGKLTHFLHCSDQAFMKHFPVYVSF
jgi:hypothetical protein